MAIEGLDDLERSFDEFIEYEVKGAALDLAKKIALQILRRIVLRSPVDRGTFRANWQVDAVSFPTEILDEIDKSGGLTIQLGAEEIQSLRDWGVIYIANNLPYALKLELGSSKQAPAGVVGVTIAEIESQFT